MHDPWGVSTPPTVKTSPPPAQPEARAARPRRKPSYTGPEAHTAVLYGQPGYKPVSTGAPRHKVTPAAPSEADLTWDKLVKAVGPDVVKKASNPRVAALQSVLGSATGIPSVVDAARTHKHLGSAAVTAASLLPVGRFGKAAELLAKAGRLGRTVKPAAEAAAAVTKVERPAVAAAKTVEKAAPEVRHVPMTEAQAAKRLAALDKQYETMLKKVAPEVNPYGKAEAAAETRGRNTMRGRMAAGKKPATGKAIEGRVGGGSKTIKTVNQEVRDRAETKIAEVIAQHPEHPVAKKVAALITERDALRAAVNARAEATFAGAPLPELPTIEVPVPGAAPVLPTERPGHLPGWGPQGQIFPRPASPGRYPAEPSPPSTLFPGEAKPTIEGTPLSPQGEMFASRAPTTKGDLARANPLSSAVPKLRPGVETPETGGQVGRMLREQLPRQKAERVLQNEGYSVERGKRFGAFNQKLQANPTLEGFHAALGELKGELPKRQLPGLSEVDTDALVRHVAFFPNLQPGEKARSIRAAEKMLEGQILQPNEIKLMEKVYGRVVVGHLSELSKFRRLKIQALDAINIPRSVMASLDVSAPGRQGLVVAATHPVLFSKNLGPMFKSLISQTTYDEYLAAIHASPNWPRMEGRVAFTELGRDLSQREEQFVSHMAETITGGKYSFVRASGRAYTGFLDKTRADLFDLLHEKAMRLDPARNPDDPKFLDDLARLVNDMTGRGQLPGFLKNHAVTLNTLFFSPRLLQSRLNLIFSPLTYGHGTDAFVRREAFKSVAETVGVLTTILAFAGWAGAKVVLDPRSADWAKIKVGNTRVDVAGGFQQPLRQIAQQLTQSTVSSTTGKTIHFGAEGPGKVTSWDTFLRFLRSKAAPIPSLAIDLTQRQTFAGDPVTPAQAVLSRVTPLGVQDAVQSGQTSGSVPAGLGAFGLSAVGVGVQSYKARKKKGGGSDPWNAGVGGGSSDPWGVSP